MNVAEYISSGILEAYVLGELSAVEKIEVEKKLIEYGELRRELSQIEATHELLIRKFSITPSNENKDKMMDCVNSQKKGKTVLIERMKYNNWRYAAAASLVFALFSAYLAVTYRNRWQQSESALTNLLTQNNQIAKKFDNVNHRLHQIESDFRIKSDPTFKRILLQGTPNAPTALASVYWNEKSKEVYLDIQNLRKLTKENQYQLWAIIDGKPIDCGVFDIGSSGLLKMNNASRAPSLFAITIEPRGGKISPTLNTMQAAGKIMRA